MNRITKPSENVRLWKKSAVLLRKVARKNRMTLTEAFDLVVNVYLTNGTNRKN